MKNLLSTVRAEQVTPYHMTMLRSIDETDFRGVCRKAKEELQKQGAVPDSGFLVEGILVLKQYYAIAALDSRNMHAVSDAIDPFWHAHILHTEEYFEFCSRIFGHYLHHHPLDHESDRDVKVMDRLYRYTVWCYDQFFNYVNPTFFPKELPVYRLVCKHQLVTTEEIWQNGILPENPEMQPQVFL